MIKTVLMATDLGPFSVHCLERAVSLCEAYQAKLLVVHAVEPLSSYAEALMVASGVQVPSISSTDEFSTGLSTELSESPSVVESLGAGPSPAHHRNNVLSQLRRRIVESVCEDGRDLLEIDIPTPEVIVQEGRPAEVILSTVAEREVGMVVLGSHGPDSLGNNLLGSVTMRVMQLSKVPVCMVPMVSPRNWYQVKNHRGSPFRG